MSEKTLYERLHEQSMKLKDDDSALSWELIWELEGIACDAAALENEVAELTKQLAITVKQYEDAERAI